MHIVTHGPHAFMSYVLHRVPSCTHVLLLRVISPFTPRVCVAMYSLSGCLQHARRRCKPLAGRPDYHRHRTFTLPQLCPDRCIGCDIRLVSNLDDKASSSLPSSLLANPWKLTVTLSFCRILSRPPAGATDHSASVKSDFLNTCGDIP